MKKKDIKILLVDDEKDILEIVGYNLAQEGYQISTASNGNEAVIKAKKELPQLIILDVMMPEMDGIEACENIRKIPELQDTIITFLTARSEDYSQVAGFDAGADDYITKPIKPKVLVSKVKALLRRFKNDSKPNSTLTVGNIEMWKIIKEALGYGIFLIVLIIISYANRDTNSYAYQNALRKAFTGRKFEHVLFRIF